jgi:hypothetical protein
VSPTRSVSLNRRYSAWLRTEGSGMRASAASSCPGNPVPGTVTVARGRGIALVLGVQALSQLDGLYGQEGADTIRTNCATKMVLHGLDYPSAEQVSRLLGE